MVYVYFRQNARDYSSLLAHIFYLNWIHLIRNDESYKVAAAKEVGLQKYI